MKIETVVPGIIGASAVFIPGGIFLPRRSPAYGFRRQLLTGKVAKLLQNRKQVFLKRGEVDIGKATVVTCIAEDCPLDPEFTEINILLPIFDLQTF